MTSSYLNPKQNPYITSPHEDWHKNNDLTKTLVPATPNLTATLITRGIGFAPHFKFLETYLGSTGTTKYPPYDLVSTGENKYEIRMAVAGFSKDEIEINVERGVLNVVSTFKEEDSALKDDSAYIHKGIAERYFAKCFPLAEHVEVKSAELKDGILTIKLEREVPEELKPKSIKIK